jgi:putative membrane protein
LPDSRRKGGIVERLCRLFILWNGVLALAPFASTAIARGCGADKIAYFSGRAARVPASAGKSKQMRYLSWFLGLVLFLLALGFAVKNSELITVRYYLGYQWQAPLALVALIFLGAGAVLGVVASLGFVFRQRREILALKRELRQKARPGEGQE